MAWLIMQIAGLTFDNFDIPVWAFRFMVIMLLCFFPVAIIATWAFELTPDGIKTDPFRPGGARRLAAFQQSAATSQASVSRKGGGVDRRGWLLKFDYLTANPVACFLSFPHANGKRPTVALIPFPTPTCIEYKSMKSISCP